MPPQSNSSLHSTVCKALLHHHSIHQMWKQPNGAGQYHANTTLKNSLRVRITTSLTVYSVVPCHFLHPYHNDLSPCLSLGTRLPWHKFGVWQCFLIRTKTCTRPIHIGFITPFMQLARSTPLLSLSSCIIAFPFPFVGVQVRLHLLHCALILKWHKVQGTRCIACTTTVWLLDDNLDVLEDLEEERELELVLELSRLQE